MDVDQYIELLLDLGFHNKEQDIGYPIETKNSGTHGQ